VRRTLWDIEAATNALELARESVEIASGLLRIVERRVEAGDLPPGDTLLARTALYEKQIDVVDSEAALLDSERAYRSLTGLDERPTAFVETRASRENFDAGHPALAFVAAEIDRARAGRALAEKSSRGNPTLTIGEHRQRDPLGTFYSNSIQMQFRLPVGGGRYGAVSRAQASRRLAESESAQGLLLRELDLALHEAEHDLFVVEESLDIVSERTVLAERQWEMAQTAFELGEIDFRDLLRVQETLLAARRDVRRFEILRDRAIAEINQALGDLP
jgi:outer membrane protein TolC